MKLLCRLSKGISLTFNWFFDMFDSLFNKHKMMRRGVIIWLLVTISLLLIFMTPLLDAGQLMSVFSQLLGAFGAFTGFYIYLRNKDND